MKYVVTSASVNLRRRGDAKSDIVGRATKGQELTVAVVDGEWGLVTYVAGKAVPGESWVNVNYCQLTGNAPDPAPVTDDYNRAIDDAVALLQQLRRK